MQEGKKRMVDYWTFKNAIDAITNNVSTLLLLRRYIKIHTNYPTGNMLAGANAPLLPLSIEDWKKKLESGGILHISFFVSQNSVQTTMAYKLGLGFGSNPIEDFITTFTKNAKVDIYIQYVGSNAVLLSASINDYAVSISGLLSVGGDINIIINNASINVDSFLINSIIVKEIK